MSNINNLTSKIMDDAKLKASSIMDEAKQEETKIVSKKVDEAGRLKANMLEKAKEEGERKKERVLSSAKLEVRNNKLAAKQEMINLVFEESIEKLSDMSSEDFLKFMKASILEAEISGTETLVVSEDFKGAVTEEVLKEINDALVRSGKKGKLVLASDSRKVKPGFIIEKQGIELNYTFEALVDSLREELLGEVANALFN